MMTITIEGLDVRYKDVGDLNKKVKSELLKIKKKRESIDVELTDLKKKEKALGKFLGIKEVAEKETNSGAN